MCLCTGPERSLGLLKVVSTISRRHINVATLSTLRTVCLQPQDTPLVFVPVTGGVDNTAIVRPEGLIQLSHLESNPRHSGLKRSASTNCAAACLHYDKCLSFVCRTQYKSFALQIMLMVMRSFHGPYQSFYCKVILYPVKNPIIGTYYLKTGLTFVAWKLNTAGSNKLTLVGACLHLYVKTETVVASVTLCKLFCILICLKIYEWKKIQNTTCP